MPKITIKVSIKSTDNDDSYQTTAILQEQLLKYLENSETTVKFNYQNNSLLRENSEFKMEYFFEKEKTTTGSFFIKGLNKKIELPIKTEELTRRANNIKIKFTIDNNQFSYEIEEIK